MFISATQPALSLTLSCTARTCAQAPNALADDEYLLFSSLGMFPTDAATAGSMRPAGVGVDERQAIDELQRELMRETGARVSLASALDASAMAFAAPAAAAASSSSSASGCLPPAPGVSISLPAAQFAFSSCERRVLAQETPRFFAPPPVVVCHRSWLLGTVLQSNYTTLVSSRRLSVLIRCVALRYVTLHPAVIVARPTRMRRGDVDCFSKEILSSSKASSNYSKHASCSGFDSSRRAALRKGSAAMTEIADGE